jgi:antitoxin component YwqK of YwqJK toxin-antitoxin module
MLKEIKTNSQHYFIDENDHLQGEGKAYRDNGQLHLHAFYQNDKLHGEFKDFHENGQVWDHKFYQNGKLHGDFRRYNDDGTIHFATFFYHGNDLNVNPDSLTKKDKTYIMLSGRLPPRDQPC